jgi:hypothetical protein
VTLVSTIITQAFRESNILALRKAPNAEQSAEALFLLNGIFAGIYGGDAGEGLTDWPLGVYGRESPNYDDNALNFNKRERDHPPINQRLIATNEQARTVWLTPYPQDGSRMGIADPFSRLATVPITLDANGRTIEGAASIVLNTDGAFTEWFYRADLASWVKLTGVIETDEMPFPQKFDNFFMILLAIRLNPRYGRELDAQSQVIFKQQRREFVARYLQSRPLEILDDVSWPFMSTQGYDQQRAFSSQRNFDRGYWG